MSSTPGDDPSDGGGNGADDRNLGNDAGRDTGHQENRRGGRGDSDNPPGRGSAHLLDRGRAASESRLRAPRYNGFSYDRVGRGQMNTQDRGRTATSLSSSLHRNGSVPINLGRPVQINPQGRGDPASSSGAHTGGHTHPHNGGPGQTTPTDSQYGGGMTSSPHAHIPRTTYGPLRAHGIGLQHPYLDPRVFERRPPPTPDLNPADDVRRFDHPNRHHNDRHHRATVAAESIIPGTGGAGIVLTHSEGGDPRTGPRLAQEMAGQMTQQLREGNAPDTQQDIINNPVNRRVDQSMVPQVDPLTPHQTPAQQRANIVAQQEAQRYSQLELDQAAWISLQLMAQDVQQRNRATLEYRYELTQRVQRIDPGLLRLHRIYMDQERLRLLAIRNAYERALDMAVDRALHELDILDADERAQVLAQHRPLNEQDILDVDERARYIARRGVMMEQGMIRDAEERARRQQLSEWVEQRLLQRQRILDANLQRRQQANQQMGEGINEQMMFPNPLVEDNAPNTIQRGGSAPPQVKPIRPPRRGDPYQRGFSQRRRRAGEGREGRGTRGDRGSRGNGGGGRGGRRNHGNRGNNNGRFHDNSRRINLLRIDEPGMPMMNPLRQCLDDPQTLWTNQQIHMRTAHALEVARIKKFCGWPRCKERNPLQISKNSDLNPLAAVHDVHGDQMKQYRTMTGTSATIAQAHQLCANQSSHKSSNMPNTGVTDEDHQRMDHRSGAGRANGGKTELRRVYGSIRRDDWLRSTANHDQQDGNVTESYDGPRDWTKPSRPADDLVEKQPTPDFSDDQGSAGLPETVQDNGSGSEYGSEHESEHASQHGSGQSDNEGSGDDDSWTWFEHGLYQPAAAENHVQMRVRSAPPALESIRADRGHLGWPDQHYGINGFRVVELAENPNPRAAEHPVVNDQAPIPSPPALTVQTDFANAAERGLEDSPSDIDPAILYMQQNDADEAGPSTAGAHTPSQPLSASTSGPGGHQHTDGGVHHQSSLHETENDGESAASGGSTSVTGSNDGKRGKKTSLQGKVKQLANRFKSLGRKHDKHGKGPDGDGGGQAGGMASAV